MNGEHSLNDRLQDVINGLAGQNAALDQVMVLIAKNLILLVPVLLLAFWLWPGRSADRALNQRVALVAVIATGIALLVGLVLGRAVPEARPFVNDTSTRLLMTHAADSGLPSDHALIGFTVGGTILWWRRRVGAVVLGGAALIGVARVYAGVHWPGDILAGALIGLIVGGLAAHTVPWWSRLQRVGCRFLPTALCARPEVGQTA